MIGEASIQSVGHIGRAAIVDKLSVPRARMLCLLLEAAEGSGGCDTLRPIWRAEEIRRADRLTELTLLLDCDTDQGGRASDWVSEVECHLANGLAACYRALTIQHDMEQRPCATPLRDIAINLINLFSPVTSSGDVLLNCGIERIALPAFQQRALVLLAGTLIMDVLVSLGRTNRHGRVDLALWTLEPGLVQFTITDDPGALVAPSQSSLVSDLANLLQAETVFHPPVSRALSRLDIVFPVHA